MRRGIKEEGAEARYGRALMRMASVLLLLAILLAHSKALCRHSRAMSDRGRSSGRQYIRKIKMTYRSCDNRSSAYGSPILRSRLKKSRQACSAGDFVADFSDSYIWKLSLNA